LRHPALQLRERREADDEQHEPDGDHTAATTVEHGAKPMEPPCAATRRRVIVRDGW
jgi:hypothetical protein